MSFVAGKDAVIEIAPNKAGKIYGTGWLSLHKVSADAKWEESRDTEQTDAYGGGESTAGDDEVKFSAKAFLDYKAGMIHAIAVTAPGSGYTSAPTVTIAAPPVGGVQATAIAEVDVATGTVTGVFITNPGSGYTSAPSVTLGAGGGTGATATASFGGMNDAVLYPLLKAGDLRIRFSPNGGSPGSKKPRYVGDLVRDNISIDAPTKSGTVVIEFGGVVNNSNREEW